MLKSRTTVLMIALHGLTISCGNNDPVQQPIMGEKQVCSYVPPKVATGDSQLMDLKCTACKNTMGCESDQMVNIQICEEGTQEKVYRVSPQDKNGKFLTPLYYISVEGKWLSADDLTARVMTTKMEYDHAVAQRDILADAVANPAKKCEQ